MNAKQDYNCQSGFFKEHPVVLGNKITITETKELEEKWKYKQQIKVIIIPKHGTQLQSSNTKKFHRKSPANISAIRAAVDLGSWILAAQLMRDKKDNYPKKYVFKNSEYFFIKNEYIHLWRRFLVTPIKNWCRINYFWNQIR